MLIYKKLLHLITPTQKLELIFLSVLMFIGVLFEMLGVGIIIPTLAILLNPNILVDYPKFSVILKKILGSITHDELVIIGMGILVFVYFIKTLYLIFLTWKQSIISTKISSFFSKKLFSGYLEMPYSFHLSRNSSDLIRNIQSEVNYFNSIAQSFITLTTEFSAILGIAVMLLFIEPKGAISVSLFLFLFAFIFYRLIRNVILKWGIERQKQEGDLARFLMEGFGSIKILKLMGKSFYFKNLFNKASEEKSVTFAKIFALQQVPRLYIELMGVVSLSVFIISMIYLSRPIDTLLPIIGVFVVAAFRLMPSINRIIGSMQNIRSAGPVVDLLYNEFILIDNTIIIEESLVKKTFFKEIIELKNICFKYPESKKFILNQISLDIRKGDSIGLFGKSGSGKSTLVDLICGLLRPNIGEIIVDGSNINNNIRDWQNKIGYVSQFIYLTDDTIRKNVAFGIPSEKIDNVKVDRAIEMAQLDEHIAGLPLGLNTIVGEQGVQLSGGQRQRIGIARALYDNPQVLILDEATSALDNKTEIEVMDSIDSIKGNITIIIIAHRLSTLSHCDKIFQLDNNTIIEKNKVDLYLDKH